MGKGSISYMLKIQWIGLGWTICQVCTHTLPPNLAPKGIFLKKVELFNLMKRRLRSLLVTIFNFLASHFPRR